MKNKLFIGGLAWATTEGSVRTACASYGEIEDCKVIMDRDTDRSRGYGFVEMSTQEEAEKAIAALNGTQHEGRSITVNISKPREDRPAGGGGGYRNR